MKFDELDKKMRIYETAHDLYGINFNDLPAKVKVKGQVNYSP